MVRFSNNDQHSSIEYFVQFLLKTSVLIASYLQFLPLCAHLSCVVNNGHIVTC